MAQLAAQRVTRWTEPSVVTPTFPAGPAPSSEPPYASNQGAW